MPSSRRVYKPLTCISYICMYLEVIGSKDIWDPPPFTAISSPSVGQGVEEAESEDKLLPLHYVTIVKVSTTDGSCSS